MSADARLIVLKLVLEELNISPVSPMRVIQSALYTAYRNGIDLGYRWHTNGSNGGHYAPMLAVDARELQWRYGEIAFAGRGKVLTGALRQRINEIKGMRGELDEDG